MVPWITALYMMHNLVHHNRHYQSNTQYIVDYLSRILYLLSSGDFLVRILLGAGYLISRVLQTPLSSSSTEGVLRERGMMSVTETQKEREIETEKEK